MWHHKHELTAIEGGVLMSDTIHYKLPFGILGQIGNQLMVKNQLKKIFDFRHTTLESLFGKMD
jgi:ligand-binding SRPBCC domain-containing protein